jgi:hypothetical protein
METTAFRAFRPTWFNIPFLVMVRKATTSTRAAQNRSVASLTEDDLQAWRLKERLYASNMPGDMAFYFIYFIRNWAFMIIFGKGLAARAHFHGVLSPSYCNRVTRRADICRRRMGEIGSIASCNITTRVL